MRLLSPVPSVLETTTVNYEERVSFVENILIDCLQRADRFWLLDGAMGTQLQKRGLPLGVQPETFNLTHPEVVTQVHREYLQAGSNILYANTFGANRKKLAGCSYTVEQVITAAIQNAKAASSGTDALVALDVGPIGELLEPTGTLTFEQAYDIFAEEMNAGIAAGADLIVLDCSAPWWTPGHDRAADIVYAAKGTDVCLTMADGRVLYRDGEYLTIDIERARHDAAAAAAAIAAQF